MQTLKGVKNEREEKRELIESEILWMIIVEIYVFCGSTNKPTISQINSTYTVWSLV